MRSTPGSSFGPMAISATTAMRTNSLHPMSNMKISAHAKPLCPNREIRIRPSASATLCRSDGLAADVRARSRGRCAVVIDRLHRFGLLGGLVIVLHALLEGLDALRDVTHQV